jgi:hypothetical protein
MYLGVKLVRAYPQEQNGAEGYCVVYEDGYTSWSPKDVFERFYYPMGTLKAHGPEGDVTLVNYNKITQDMVDGFVESRTPLDCKMGNKTTVAQIRTITEMEVTESSACVDPDNYNHDLGITLARAKAVDKIWFGLGFVLQWAKNGLKR